MIETIIRHFNIEGDLQKWETISGGLINHTWKIVTTRNEYVLQRINDQVFKKPLDIAYNIELIWGYLKVHHPEFIFTSPVATHDGKTTVQIDGEGYFRMFPFIKGSHTIDVVQSPKQAFEAAIQFGRFTRLLHGLDVAKLKITIPHFHDLSLRYDAFIETAQKGNPLRIRETQSLIDELKGYDSIVEKYKNILQDPDFKLRVIHHDTKISNVLFDEKDHGVCVIDLDTVMPGYFFSDVGDMMRTYLSPVNEEEADISKIKIRSDIFQAIRSGYLQEMGGELTPKEQENFSYSGQFMIYMQALRFLTDHLNNDIYYGARYEGHNLVRAKNQTALLREVLSVEG